MLTNQPKKPCTQIQRAPLWGPREWGARSAKIRTVFQMDVKLLYILLSFSMVLLKKFFRYHAEKKHITAPSGAPHPIVVSSDAPNKIDTGNMTTSVLVAEPIRRLPDEEALAKRRRMKAETLGAVVQFDPKSKSVM